MDVKITWFGKAATTFSESNSDIFQLTIFKWYELWDGLLFAKQD